MKNLFSKSLSRRKVTIAFASVVVYAAWTGFYQVSKKAVAFTFHGKQKIAHAHTIHSFKGQKAALYSKDAIFLPEITAPIKGNMDIIWKRAKQVQIVEDDVEKTIWTTADTVAEVLQEQNLVFTKYDQISPLPSMPIKNKMKIQLRKAYHLTLVDGGKQQEVWSTSTTVADFLKQQGIKLNDLDRVEPSFSETVKENDIINVIRVEKVTDVVEEPVKFAKITRIDRNLEKGKSVILSEGVQGINLKKYEVILENGKVISRNLISEMRVKEKRDKVVAVGTKDMAFQVSRGQSSIYVRATAYTADCNGCSGQTATGLNLYANPNAKVIAVDPRIIPLGSKVYVDGYGYAVAADTGGAIKGYSIDVFFSSKAEAYRWGARNIKITVLN